MISNFFKKKVATTLIWIYKSSRTRRVFHRVSGQVGGNIETTIYDPPILCMSLCSHVGRFHNPRMCQLYFVGSLNNIRIFFYYSYIQAHT